MTADAELWDRELAERAPRAPLLQSWGWGEVQSRAGWSVERLRISPGGAMASVQIRKVGLAREVYVPRGPLPATIEAIDGLVKWARRSRSQTGGTTTCCPACCRGAALTPRSHLTSTSRWRPCWWRGTRAAPTACSRAGAVRIPS